MYQAMYRKYRPKTFDDVAGQEQIVKTLSNSIKTNRINHAYIFYGPRGTGKTTIAKIFARAVNCENPDNGNFCGKCKSCEISAAKECVDIIEIDAASNNGVDEIRELRSKINFVPADLKYKVYIIDEVHMLTVGAFNALLKTLEEPPEHAIFILATTDFHKVPETIISRCQCFEFKRLEDEIIRQRLVEISKKEKITIDDDVIDNIAKFSDGGLRDAIGMLDKLASYEDKRVTMETFVALNGLITKEELEKLTNIVIDGNNKELLEEIAKFNSNGKNIIQIMSQELFYLRDQIVSRYLNNNLDGIEKLQKLANEVNSNMEKIKKSNNPKIFVEILLLSYIANFNSNDNNKISEKQEKIEQKTLGNNISQEQIISREIISENKSQKNEVPEQKKELKTTSDKILLNYDELLKNRINNTFANATKDKLNELKQDFEKLREHSFDQKKGYLVCDLLESEIRAVGNNTAIISYEFDSIVSKNIEQLEQLEKVYKDVIGKTIKLAIISQKKWDELKKEYISNIKNNNKYKEEEEIKPVYEKIKKNDIIDNATTIFGDIVEYE